MTKLAANKNTLKEKVLKIHIVSDPDFVMMDSPQQEHIGQQR